MQVITVVKYINMHSASTVPDQLDTKTEIVLNDCFLLLIKLFLVFSIV